MGQKGINPKAWFYGLREALVNERNRPCVLAGAACEQWLNGELFRVVAEGLGKTKLTAYPEWKRRQHDVAVLPYRPNDPDAWYSPVAIAECKVLYSNYSPGKRAAYLDRLLEQVSAKHSGSLTRVGFLIGVYAYWPGYRKPPKESFRDFRQAIGGLLRSRVEKGIPGFSVQVDHGGAMETFLEETKSKVGAAEVVVGCVAQYFRLIPA